MVGDFRETSLHGLAFLRNEHVRMSFTCGKNEYGNRSLYYPIRLATEYMSDESFLSFLFQASAADDKSGSNVGPNQQRRCIEELGTYYQYGQLSTTMSFHDDNLLIPGPDFHIDLPRIDACHPVHYARRLLIFRCQSEDQRAAQLSSLKKGLEALIEQCPLLAGALSRLPPDEASTQVEEWRTIVPSLCLELVVRDLREKMPGFKELEAEDFPSHKLLYDLLVPIPKDVGNEGPACKVQFSAIEGGSILCWAMSHSVGDGGANNELIRILSEEIKLANENTERDDQERQPMNLSRSAVKDVHSNVLFRLADHSGYRAAPLSSTPEEAAERSIHPFRATTPEKPLLFTISSASLAQLKSDATPASPAWISTHDALVALLWRTQIQLRRQRSAAAQKLPDSTLTTLFMPSDARKALNVPKPYIGNAIYQLSATLPLSALLSENGLKAAALAIRQAIIAVSPEKVKSYYAQMREEWIEWAFLGSYDTTGVAMGTAWTSGDLYELDWGVTFGKLCSYRMPNEAFNSIMPKLPNGGAEILVSVMPGEVEKLKGMKSFIKYTI